MKWIGPVYKKLAGSELGAGHTSGIVPVKSTETFFGAPIQEGSHQIKTIVIEFWYGLQSNIIKTHVMYFVSKTHRHIHLTGNLYPAYKRFDAKAGDVLLFWRSADDPEFYRAELIKQGTARWAALQNNFTKEGGILSFPPYSEDLKEEEAYQTEGVIDTALNDSDFPPTKRILIAPSTSVKKTLPQKSKAKGDYALEKANYQCELNRGHRSFLTPKGRPFMEKHHLIPMEFYEQFEYTLDDINNLICLCPTCHKALHFGRKQDIEPPLRKLWKSRIDQLKRSHLEVDLEKLKVMYFG